MKIVLTVVEGPYAGQTFSFDKHDHFFVGRAKFAHFRLPEKDPHFSRMHFMIEANPPACRLLDLGSTNGTCVNNETVHSMDLHDGDRIEAGNTVFLVSIRHNEVEDKNEQRSPTANNAEVLHKGAEKKVSDRINTKPTGQPVLRATDPASSGWQPCGYEIREILGRGSMGIVYRAIRIADEREFAMKVIQPKIVGSNSDIKRFLREVKILSQLEHPAIVRLIETGDADGLLYFSMELIKGADAQRHVEKQLKPLSIQKAVGITYRVLEGLEHAHRSGFVHRDVKPSNILLARQGDQVLVKLTDFSLARAYQESILSGLSLTGDICGTPHYMAPEQIIDCRKVKPASDQFSTAATLYWLLTKKPTHDFAGGLSNAIYQILNVEPIPITNRRSDIPPALASAIHRAMEKDPADRFPSVAKFRSALKAAIRT